MRIFLILWRRELLASLRSIQSWCLIAAFATASGLLLLAILNAAEGSIQTLPSLFARLLALLLPALTTLITMRTFAEDSRSGTLESLLTAPVSDAAVVGAKFWASLTLVAFALGAAVLGFVLYVETARPAPVYSRTGVAAALAVLLLHAAAWTAAGTLAALLTRHQAVAAVLSLLATVPHSLLAAGLIPGVRGFGYADALSVTHVARGVVDSRPILLCISATAFFLFAAVRRLEARRWQL